MNVDITMLAALEAASNGCNLTQRVLSNDRQVFLVRHNGHFVGVMSADKLARWVGVK